MSETKSIYTTRKIDHDEAREIAQRLINSHFRKEPHARVGIPARPDYDDDLLIYAYINQQAALTAAEQPRAQVDGQWKMVPVEPTEAMREALWYSMFPSDAPPENEAVLIGHAYDAMLSASPPPPASRPDPRIAELEADVARLTEWADGFSDAQLKERRLCEEHIRELQQRIEKAEAALAEAAKVIEPFAKLADGCDHFEKHDEDYICVFHRSAGSSISATSGQCRVARDWLSRNKDNDNV